MKIWTAQILPSNFFPCTNFRQNHEFEACNSVIVLKLVGSSVTQGNSLMMTWSFNKTFFKEDAKRIWRQALLNSIWNLLKYFAFWKSSSALEKYSIVKDSNAD